MAGELTSYECPHCGQAVEAMPQAESQLVHCPACGGEFIIPAADTPAEEVQADHELGELDSLRMRHIVVVRRAATVGTDPVFVAMLRDLVLERIDGPVLDDHGGVGTQDECPAHCCLPRADRVR